MNHTRVLCLTRYDELGASSRYRFMQYFPYLEQLGIDITFAPLLDNEYIARMYSGGLIQRGAIARGYLHRLGHLLRSGSYDVIWIEKEALPFIPGGVERLLLSRRIPYVLDYDDAVFHNFDNTANPITRRLLHKKYDRVMQGAEIVVAGNSYIADYARNAGSKRVEIVPTVVDLRKYELAARRSGAPVRIGWIGTPRTAKYLDIVKNVAASHVDYGDLEFVFIGSGDVKWNLENVEIIPWTASTETSDLRSLSVGIMPLVDSPFERGKCGLKLLQYMAAGLPVIASPVGVNKEIVEDGVNGFLAENSDEWERAVHLLSTSEQMRLDFGIAGRMKVERLYSLERTAPKVRDLLVEAASRP